MHVFLVLRRHPTWTDLECFVFKILAICTSCLLLSYKSRVWCTLQCNACGLEKGTVTYFVLTRTALLFFVV